MSQIQKPATSVKPNIPKNEINILDFDEPQPQKSQITKLEQKQENLFDLINE